jgi:hypothetical protein
MMGPEDLIGRLEDLPFKPFRIHMSDGTLIEVVEPGMVIVGRTTAVLPRSFSRDEDGRRVATIFRTISLGHVVQFSDMEEKMNGRQRRKRK